jgi:hypothetical protein
MNPPENFEQVVNRRRYSTATATLLAGNDYWDGHNYERRGRNTFLYKTPKGAYFVVELSQWVGEENHIEPITEDDAVHLFENWLSEHRMSYEDAFPNVIIEDA